MSDIVTGKTFVDGEKGVTALKLNQIQSLAVIQPAFYTGKPSSATLDPTDVLLELKGTGSYAQITGSNLINSVAASVSSTRPRSFNAIGNPSFEVDQRNAGTAAAVTPTVNGWVDRWITQLAGTARASCQQIAANVVLPGTNFLVTQNILRITLTTIKASLAATDYMVVQQAVEGPQLRELLNDVHSVSILARSSVANLKFGLYLADAAGTHTLSKLCTLGAANTWTLIQLPNFPIWMAGATWGLTPGVYGYGLGISLAAGSTYTAAANDVWAATSAFGALGQSNFAAGPVNSTFDLAFIQHEPGAQCTTLIDCPFSGPNGNLEACLRYFQKTCSYNVKPGAVDPNGALLQSVFLNTHCWAPLSFKKPLAKAASVVPYSPTTGAVNNLRNVTSGADVAIASIQGVGDSGFGGFNLAALPAANSQFQFHYTADSGW